jgi:pimeloyl-ACP methyl ester carboxylesterase
MTHEEFVAERRFIYLPAGRIAYVERGEGPVALFVHGVPLNGYHWRHQVAALSDIRRCLCPDLMGLGASETDPGTPVDFQAQAHMLLQLIDALGVSKIDLVGNDSGGAISQILATQAPDRIRSLTLTNCDTHGNWPPPAFMPILNLAKAGQLGHAFAAFRADPELARSPSGLGVAFEFPERLTPELLDAYLAPLVATPTRMDQVNAYVSAIETPPTAALLQGLKAFHPPTLIVWGDADVFFGPDWGRWLAETIPGVRRLEILSGARLFFPEERHETFNALLREHWTTATMVTTASPRLERGPESQGASSTSMTGPGAADRYTPLKIVRTVAYALAVWSSVAIFIRFGGAAGQFSGRDGMNTYLATAVLTLPLNWLNRKAAGMPASKMPVVVAMTLTVTTLLEGVLMKWFPEVYGGDPAVIAKGAIWLLYAVGMGLGASVVTAAWSEARR